jgi:FkbM family methyltransferase
MDFAADLNELLNEDVQDARARESTAFEHLAGPLADRVVLFGAGGLGQRTLAKLRSVGIEPVAFADNNPARWGTEHEGVAILAPEEAAEEYGSSAAFVVTIWGAGSPHRLEDTRAQLTALGCEVVVPFAWFAWRHSDQMLPYYGIDLPSRLLEQSTQVRRGFELMADDQSRREYVAQVRWRLTGDPGCLDHPVDEPQYLAAVAHLSADERILDCGAYDGDTLQSWLSTIKEFGRYVALEPDPDSRHRLEVAIAELPDHLSSRVTVLPFAVASEEGTETFAASGTGASSFEMAKNGSGGLEVECRRIDQLVEELGAPVPTMLKMDIEGAELDALHGAIGLIEEQAPVLTLCVYHRQTDLWTIPLFVSDHRDDYRFFLRPHNEEGWDLVCYVVPASRAA